MSAKIIPFPIAAPLPQNCQEHAELAHLAELIARRATRGTARRYTTDETVAAIRSAMKGG